MKLHPCLFLLLLTAASSPAALLLDNAGTVSPILRSANWGLGRQVVVDADQQVNITELQINFTPSANGNLTFVAYEHVNSSTHQLIGSSTVSFVAGQNWYSSGSLNWTFDAGKTYDVVAYANVSGNYYYYNAPKDGSGLTSVLNMPRLDNGSLVHTPGFDGSMNIYGDVSPVPEPATVALAIFAGIWGSAFCFRQLRYRTRPC